MERIGPFIIESVLGQGGCGTVYRARHSQSGSLAAVKAVGPISGQARKTLRREIEELSRFSHPGIVRIREHDTDADPPYYAMDLVEGPTLAAWAASAPPSPGNELSPFHVQAIARIVGRLCLTLAHMHAEGLVHRDLSPDNILIRASGEPILVDFGLVARFPGAVNRESLPVDLSPAGQLAYMAPEVVKGELIDARADLYSVGCILYELLTGAPPFTGSVRAILDGHLHRAPAPPAAVRRGIPPALDELTLALLAKAAGERHAQAADIAEKLLGHAGEAAASGELRAPPLLYRARLLGREADLIWFDQILARTAEGRGGISAVAGESGIGKTRLLMEVSRRAMDRGFATFAGTCETLGGRRSGLAAGGPLAGLREPLAALADRCQEWGVGESERVLGPRGKILAPFEASLARVPGQERHPEPPSLAADGNRQRILDALTETWLAISQATPVLLIIDDLQRADELTLFWLELIGRGGALERSRISIVVSYRDEEVEAPLAKVVGGGFVQRRHLESFEPSQVLDLVRDMLGTEALDGSVGASLAAVAAGNPLFVTEYLQLALADGTIRRNLGGWCVSAPPAPGAVVALQVPGSVSEVVRLRLQRLSPPARRIAEIATVLGSQVSATLLRELAGGDEPAVGAAILELQRRRVLTTGEDPEVVRFTHDKLREVLYDKVLQAEKRALHRAAGLALERGLSAEGFSPRQGGQLYAVLAQHFLIASDRDRALLYLDRAADEAVGTFSNREACSYLRAALEVTSQEPARVVQRARWLRLLGTAENALGEIDASRGSFAGALDLLGHPFPGSRVALMGGVLGEATRYLAGLVPRRFSTEPPEDAASVRATEAVLAHQGIGYLISDGLAVLYNCLKMLNLAHEAATPSALTRASATMGLALGLAPSKRGAEHFFRLARRAAAGGGDAESEAWALVVEGYYRLGQGDLSLARSSLEGAQAACARIRDLRRSDECLILLGEVAILAWDAARACQLSEEALVSARARVDVQVQLWALSHLARVYLELGRNEEALRLLLQAAAFLQKTVPADRVMLNGVLALAHLRLGDLAEAFTHAREATSLLRDTESAVYHTITGCWTAGEALLQLANHPAAAPREQCLQLAAACAAALKRHGRHHPVAWPRYWLIEGARRRALGLRSAGKAFQRAARAAQTLGLPREAELARAETAR